VAYLALAGGIGRVEEDGTVALLALDAPSLAAHLAAGGTLADLARAPARERVASEQVARASLVGSSATVWGIGLNYHSKQRATGRKLPEHPVLFAKAPSALAQPGEPVVVPQAAPSCVDYEGEIAVVVGAPLFEADARAAEAAVAAVAAANDVTARDVMRHTGSPTLAKSFPSFGQLASEFFEPSELGGLGAVTVETHVNGELRQRDRADGMILPVGELLALLSRYVVLRPGDVVLTGTPAGTGEDLGAYLVPGDVVEVSIGGREPLRSEVAELARVGCSGG
jgi:2-keto-4-pentenoate hydratase/2-oxohepta-3-ene-1,7-dioic acid hydratase in catechol pathway